MGTTDTLKTHSKLFNSMFVTLFYSFFLFQSFGPGTKSIITLNLPDGEGNCKQCNTRCNMTTTVLAQSQCYISQEFISSECALSTQLIINIFVCILGIFSCTADFSNRFVILYVLVDCKQQSREVVALVLSCRLTACQLHVNRYILVWNLAWVGKLHVNKFMTLKNCAGFQMNSFSAPIFFISSLTVCLVNTSQRNL